MRRRQLSFIRAFSALALVLACSAMLRADQSTGTLRVRVADDVTGSVAIIISSDADPARQRSARISAAGPVTFAGLPPARYQISATLPGGYVEALTVDLAAAEIVEVRVAARTAAGGAGALAVADRHADAQLSDFGARALHVLPAGSVDALVETAAPFVIVDAVDSGGIAQAQSRLVGSRGASSRQDSTWLGDIELMARPGTGVTALAPEVNVLDAVVVSSGLERPDITSPGAAITFAPRRAANQLAGAIGASFTGSGLTATNMLAGVPSIAAVTSWKHVDGEVGMPLSDRGGLFLSSAATRARKVEGGLSAETPIDSTSIFAHGVSNVTARDQVRVLGAVQGLVHEFDGRTQFADRAETEQDRVVHVQTAWEHQRQDGSRAGLTFAVQHGTFTPEVGATSATVDRLLDGPIPAPAAASSANRLDARLLFEPREHRGPAGAHALQFTWLVSRSTSSAHILASPPLAEAVAGLPARVWVRSLPSADSSRHVTATSAYVADRLAASAHFTMDLGLGVGFSSGSAGTPASSASWATLLPRAAFRWSPPGVSFFGGYGRYQPALTLDHLAFGDPGEAAVQVYRWNDINANRRLDPGETGQVLIARSGRSPDVASIDPGLRAPRTNEWTIGLESQVSRSSLLRAAVTIRHEQDLIRSVNVGAPVSSYVGIPVADQGEDYSSPTDDRLLTVYSRLPASFGQDRFLLMNTAERGSYGGIELTYILRTTHWWSSFGAMAYRTKGIGGNPGFRSSENDQGVLGETFENPNAMAYEDGALFFDRSYVAKWAMAYQAPHDLSIALAIRYQDGQPFSRVIAATGLTQGPEYVTAYRIGRTRFTFTETVDLRVEQRFRVGGRHASLWLDVFNLINDANEVEENVLTGPQFRQSTYLQPPRTARVGFRFEF